MKKLQENILKIIKDQGLEHYQKVISLAREAENSLDVLGLTEREKSYSRLRQKRKRKAGIQKRKLKRW